MEIGNGISSGGVFFASHVLLEIVIAYFVLSSIVMLPCERARLGNTLHCEL